MANLSLIETGVLTRALSEACCAVGYENAPSITGHKIRFSICSPLEIDAIESLTDKQYIDHTACEGYYRIQMTVKGMDASFAIFNDSYGPVALHRKMRLVGMSA